MNPANYVALSAVLFTIGATTVLVRRNAIIVFLGVELMLNSANLALVAFARIGVAAEIKPTGWIRYAIPAQRRHYAMPAEERRFALAPEAPT